MALTRLCRAAAALAGRDTPTTRPAAPPVHIVRATTLVTDRQVAAMVAAIDTQVARDFAPAHGLLPSRVLVGDPRALTTADRVILLVDDAGDDAYGWHSEGAGDFVHGTVGVKVILEHGGHVLTGANSVSTVLSHEVLELCLNPSVSLWADTGHGYFVPREAADAVQSDHYAIDGVAVSDFVLPDWFSPVVSRGDRFDHLGRLSAPFELAPGGYTLVCQGGEITTRYAAEPPPQWLMARKFGLDTARTRRLVESRPA